MLLHETLVLKCERQVLIERKNHLYCKQTRTKKTAKSNEQNFFHFHSPKFELWLHNTPPQQVVKKIQEEGLQDVTIVMRRIINAS